MKIYSVILFLLALNVCLGIVQSEPLFNANLENSPPIYIGGTTNVTGGEALN